MISDWVTNELNSINQSFGIINTANSYLSAGIGCINPYLSGCQSNYVSGNVSLDHVPELHVSTKNINLINKHKLLQLI